MPSENTDTIRRRLLKSIGATSIAFGAMGVATATEGDAETPEAASKSDDDISTEGYWEYQCAAVECDSGTDCQHLKRYCNSGGCSGWETNGCCKC